MSGPLGELVDQDVLVIYLWAIGLAVARMAGMMAVLPLLGRTSVQGIVRNSIVLALSLPVVPVVVDALLAGPFPGHFFLMMLVGKELFVGVVLGLVVALPIFAMQMAGVFLDMQRGGMLAEELGNVGTESTLLGGFLALLMITYTMVSGAFLRLLDGYVESLVVWPPTVSSSRRPSAAFRASSGASSPGRWPSRVSSVIRSRPTSSTRSPAPSLPWHRSRPVLESLSEGWSRARRRPRAASGNDESAYSPGTSRRSTERDGSGIVTGSSASITSFTRASRSSAAASRQGTASAAQAWRSTNSASYSASK